MIASKGKHLQRSCGEEIHGATEHHCGDNDRHNLSTSLAARGAEKDVSERLYCGDTKGVFHVSHIRQKVKIMMKPERPLSKAVHVIPWVRALEACRFEKASRKRL